MERVFVTLPLHRDYRDPRAQLRFVLTANETQPTSVQELLDAGQIFIDFYVSDTDLELERLISEEMRNAPPEEEPLPGKKRSSQSAQKARAISVIETYLSQQGLPPDKQLTRCLFDAGKRGRSICLYKQRSNKNPETRTNGLPIKTDPTPITIQADALTDACLDDEQLGQIVVAKYSASRGIAMHDDNGSVQKGCFWNQPKRGPFEGIIPDPELITGIVNSIILFAQDPEFLPRLYALAELEAPTKQSEVGSQEHVPSASEGSEVEKSTDDAEGSLESPPSSDPASTEEAGDPAPLSKPVEQVDPLRRLTKEEAAKVEPIAEKQIDAALEEGRKAASAFEKAMTQLPENPDQRFTDEDDSDPDDPMISIGVETVPDGEAETVHVPEGTPKPPEDEEALPSFDLPEDRA